MRPINNPFSCLPGYNCFGCAPHNENGLQMSFVEEDGEIISTWNPKPVFQGYFRVLHGGIQASLMDEIASWVVFVKLKTAGFTSRADIRYRKTVYVDEGPLTLRAKAVGMRKNLADISVQLFNSRQEICAEAKFVYFTYSAEEPEKNMYYPDFEDFYAA